MKKTKILLVTLIFIVSCNRNTHESEIIIKLIDFGSFYKYPKEKKEDVIKQLDSIEKNTNNDPSIEHLLYLKNEKILFNPYVYIKNDKTYKTLYMSDSQFNKLKKYTNSYLRDNKKVIKIKFLLSKEHRDIFYTDSILTVVEKDGKTLEFK